MTSLRALARELGVSDMAVRKGIKAGRFPNSIGHDSDGRPGVIDIEVARQEWAAGSRKSRREPSSSHGSQPAIVVSVATLNEAQRQATLERARKLKLENDVTEGRLVSVERVSKEAFESARTIREAMLNLPARLAGELAAETGTDAGRMHLTLDRAIREALNTTADQLLAIVHA